MKQTFLLFMLFPLLCMSGKAQTIANGDFESWTSISYYDIDLPWTSSNYNTIIQSGKSAITKVPGKVGSAIRIKASSNTKTKFNDLQFIAPYQSKPESIMGYYRCHIAIHDTAWLEVAFLKEGKYISMEKFPLAGEISTFSSFNFPIHVPENPDSVIIYVYVPSGNNLTVSKSNTSESFDNWIELDEMAFKDNDITKQITGGNFESWETKTADIPAGWQIKTDYASATLSKSTDCYSGQNSMEMSGLLTLQNEIGIGFNLKNDTLTGYYKYKGTEEDESGNIFIALKKDGKVLLQKNRSFPFATSWQYFEIPISQNNLMADSLLIQLGISNDGKTSFLIDGLRLKSQSQNLTDDSKLQIKTVHKE